MPKPNLYDKLALIMRVTRREAKDMVLRARYDAPYYNDLPPVVQDLITEAAELETNKPEMSLAGLEFLKPLSVSFEQRRWEVFIKIVDAKGDLHEVVASADAFYTNSSSIYFGTKNEWETMKE